MTNGAWYVVQPFPLFEFLWLVTNAFPGVISGACDLSQLWEVGLRSHGVYSELHKLTVFYNLLVCEVYVYSVVYDKQWNTCSLLEHLNGHWSKEINLSTVRYDG